MVNSTQNLRKKILYVVTKSGWGGAQRYVYDLAANLPKDKFEVVVASGENGLLAERLREKNTRVVNIPAFQRDINLLKEVAALFQLLKIYRQEKPDIIHLNSSKAGALGSLAAFLHKIVAFRLSLVTIFTVHGWAFNEDRNFFSKFFLWLASWFSSFFIDKFIIICQADLKSAQKFIPPGKLKLIPHGIGPIDFYPREEARKILTKKAGREIAPEEILIGTIAELTKNKGLLRLVDVANQLKPRVQNSKFKILIVGDGEYKNKLQQQIKTLGLQNEISLVGFLPDASKYLKAFDIFVLPSLKEGLPYTIIEAMSAGLPVVASRVGGIPDLINHAKNGFLVTPKNIEELAENLEKLIQNSTLRQQLGLEAKQKIEKNFSFQKMLNQTINFYPHT